MFTTTTTETIFMLLALTFGLFLISLSIKITPLVKDSSDRAQQATKILQILGIVITSISFTRLFCKGKEIHFNILGLFMTLLGGSATSLFIIIYADCEHARNFAIPGFIVSGCIFIGSIFSIFVRNWTLSERITSLRDKEDLSDLTEDQVRLMEDGKKLTTEHQNAKNTLPSIVIGQSIPTVYPGEPPPYYPTAIDMALLEQQKNMNKTLDSWTFSSADSNQEGVLGERLFPSPHTLREPLTSKRQEGVPERTVKMTAQKSQGVLDKRLFPSPHPLREPLTSKRQEGVLDPLREPLKSKRH